VKADKHSLDQNNQEIWKELEQERIVNINLNSENSKLKALLQSQEATKNELLSKLSNTSWERFTDEKDKQGLFDEIKHLKT